MSDLQQILLYSTMWFSFLAGLALKELYDIRKSVKRIEEIQEHMATLATQELERRLHG